MTPVDNRMETLGGEVFRADREYVESEQRTRDVAALRAEIAQLKAERAQARADQKAKLQAKIDKLQQKVQAKLQEAKQRSEQQRKEAEAKVQALEKKAAKAKDEKRLRWKHGSRASERNWQSPRRIPSGCRPSSFPRKKRW